MRPKLLSRSMDSSAAMWLRSIVSPCPWLQAFRLNGVEPFRPEGEKFDPNQHEALFQLPDPSKEPGTVGVVTKVLRVYLI